MTHQKPHLITAEGGLTRAQFIVKMILAYGRRYPGIKAAQAMPMAARTYGEFIESEKIEFGDPRYDWTGAGAHTLVSEMEAYA
jgi:hypothetical protein